MSDIARQIAELDAEQRARFEHRLLGRGVRTEEGQPIPRKDECGPGPLSFGQERLWFLDQLRPDCPLYHISQAVRIRGPLDPRVLHRALNTLVGRHDSLRTTIVTTDGTPLQVVAAGRAVDLPVIDVGRYEPAQREAQVRAILGREVRRPFNLACDLMLRAALLRLGEGEHVFLLVMHHIASDLWSLGVFNQELTILYEALAAGRPCALPELPIRYRDFAHWQRQRLQGKALEQQLGYWKERLAGAPPVLELPTDRPRPAVQTRRGASSTVTFPGALLRRLQALSRQEGVTLFMTLLAAFKTLLLRYTGQEDIVVGTAMAGRDRLELEGLVGFFVNTVALRTNLSGNPTFPELLRRVREVMLGAHAHQDVPFERLVQELRPERNVGHQPIFQVMFTLQHQTRPPLDLPGLRSCGLDLDLDSGTAKFDMTVFLFERSDALGATVEYSTDLFEPGTIARLIRHYQLLLEGIAADRQRQLWHLPLLSDPERQQVLVTWNATRTNYPRDACIQELFEAQALQRPDAIAVAFSDRQVTYRELDLRANQLAHHLQKLGVGPEVPVGVCLERSPEMIVGLLGILKAGGAYVPLDPTCPPERLRYLLEDARTPVVLTQQRLLPSLPACASAWTCVDADDERIARERSSRPDRAATAENLAYVIYTSGSTGRPKGTMVTHRAICRLVVNTDYVRLRPVDRVAQASNPSFDAATFEIWGALVHGARLVIIPAEVVLSPRELAEYVRRQEVSVLFVTTALFNQLAQTVPGIFRPLNHVLFGGEAADPRLVREVLDKGPPQRLLHMYGPTETTTFATWHQVQAVPEGARTVPIGRPIANTQVYLLDPHRQPVPPGVPGEVYIGGDGLARGYLNRPGLTADTFIPNPFGEGPQARLYKTGDRARYLADGTMEFLGRSDNQVKIRGFRVELGEVEAVLGQHPAVRRAVVLARTGVAGEQRLIAYIVPGPAGAPPRAELRRFLRERLPEQMVPWAFVPLQALPLTATGKVDRQALPAPDGVRLEGEQTFVRPRNALERQLAQVWERLLDVRPVGATDDFFELGGHSLLAARMMDEVAAAVGKRLSLATLFEGATVGHLAEALLKHTGADCGSLLAPFRPRGPRRPFFFLHGDYADGGLYCLNLVRYLDADQPVYLLQPHGLQGRAVPPTIEAMAEAYLRVVRGARPAGPYLLGGFCNGGLIAFEMARRLRQQGQGVDLLVVIGAPANGGVSRPLRWFIGACSRLLRLSLAQQVDLVVLLREFARRWRERRAWGKVRTVVQGAVKAATLAGLLRRAGRAPAAASFSKNDLHYGKAVSDYIPPAYPGRVTLLRHDIPAGADPALGWRAVAAEVVVHAIPGDHTTCLTDHVHVLAERLNACLRQCLETGSLQAAPVGRAGPGV
jgi:amino acid adenylation domain-containing protein